MASGELVGNQVPRYSGWKLIEVGEDTRIILPLETKYRDIADGNALGCM